MTELGARDPWSRLADRTPARIALGRVGAGLPTREVLKLGLAHARARDAVHAAFEADAIAAQIAALGLPIVQVESAVASRDEYLRRPDRGRVLSVESSARLDGVAPGTPDVALVIGDGLSATAVHAHAGALVAALQPHLQRAGRSLAPVVIARQARVALADAIGERLHASLAVMLIGERPGLSAADSLGAYLTWQPRTGRHDAERNCVSNIRAGGLSYEEAAFRIAWLANEALRRAVSGVALKDDSGHLLLER